MGSAWEWVAAALEHLRTKVAGTEKPRLLLRGRLEPVAFQISRSDLPCKVPRAFMPHVVRVVTIAVDIACLALQGSADWAFHVSSARNPPIRDLALYVPLPGVPWSFGAAPLWPLDHVRCASSIRIEEILYRRGSRGERVSHRFLSRAATLRTHSPPFRPQSRITNNARFAYSGNI